MIAVKVGGPRRSARAPKPDRVRAVDVRLVVDRSRPMNWMFGTLNFRNPLIQAVYRVPKRRQPALAAQISDPGDLVVGAVEEDLQLLAGERALARVLLVLLVMAGAVPVVHDLAGVRAKCLLTDGVPAVAGVGEVVAEQPQAVLVGADGQATQVVLRTEVAEELVDVTDRPRPRHLVAVPDEPGNHTCPAVDGRERQVPGQLLVPPPGQHVVEDLISTVARGDPA